MCTVQSHTNTLVNLNVHFYKQGILVSLISLTFFLLEWALATNGLHDFFKYVVYIYVAAF